MSGDATQFSRLLTEHARLITRIASGYTRSTDDRRDLVQEISTQLWRAYPRFDSTRAKLTTWLYRIALNVAISHLRRARVFEPLADDQRDTREPADDRIGPLYAVIDELPPLDRALVLLYLEARPYAEIAEILGISESNVATKLNRLKHVLRARLTRAEGA